MNNMNNTKTKYTQLDAGHTIINVCCEDGRHGLTVTAYINGLSVKSPALKLARVVRVFIDGKVQGASHSRQAHIDLHLRIVHRLCYLDALLGQFLE